MRYELMCVALAIGGASCAGNAAQVAKTTAPAGGEKAADGKAACENAGEKQADEKQAAEAKAACEKAAEANACRGRPGDSFDLSSVICIDARTPGRMTQLRSVTERGDSDDDSPQITLAANRTIVVRVLVGGQKVSSVSLSGATGETIAEIVGSTSEPKTSGGAATDTEAGNGCDQPWMYCAKFAPRTPGVARLRVAFEPEAKSKGVELDFLGLFNLRIGDPAPPPPPGKHFDFEYLIPRTYAGAIRTGISAIWRGNDEAYSSAPRGGAMSGVVTQLSTPRFTHELVIGYAPFPGRTYVHPLKWYARGRRAWYFGLGVIAPATSSDGGTKAAWLRSLYVGREHEVAQGVSLALVGVIRRADRLADGINVGDVVPAGTSLTKTEVQLGVGLVLNLTPDFFKVAGTVGGK